MHFYYFENGERKGPVNAAQLKTLAATGAVAPGTTIETDSGKRLKADKIKGLVFQCESKNNSVAPPSPPRNDSETFGGYPLSDDVRSNGFSGNVGNVVQTVPRSFELESPIREKRIAPGRKQDVCLTIVLICSAVFAFFGAVESIYGGVCYIGYRENVKTGEKISNSIDSDRFDATNQIKSTVQLIPKLVSKRVSYVDSFLCAAIFFSTAALLFAFWVATTRIVSVLKGNVLQI